MDFAGMTATTMARGILTVWQGEVATVGAGWGKVQQLEKKGTIIGLPALPTPGVILNGAIPDAGWSGSGGTGAVVLGVC